MLTRRNILTMAAGAPIAGTLGRGLAVAAEARKQIKITEMETDLLRVPAAPYSDAIHDFGGDGGGYLGAQLVARPFGGGEGVLVGR